MTDIADLIGLTGAVERARDITDLLQREEAFKHGYADVMHKCLMQRIAEFEANLGQEEEIGCYLASFGKEILIRIEEIDHRNPYLIIFHGSDIKNGKRVQLAQHVSQMNVLFIAVPKAPERTKPNRIGFATKDD